MSGWDEQIKAVEVEKPGTPSPTQRKRSSRRSTVQDEDAMSQQIKARGEALHREAIQEEISDHVNALLKSVLDLKKRSNVLGVGKPYPTDSADKRAKLLKACEGIRRDCQKQMKQNRDSCYQNALSNQFRAKVDEMGNKVQTDMRDLLEELNQRFLESPPPVPPRRRSSAAPMDDSSLQLSIVQDDSDVEEELLQEKNENLAELEENFDAVADVINDLAVMVHEQGDLIDKVETNVSTAKENVSDGVGSLQQAKKYQAEARKKIVLMALGVIVSAICGIGGYLIYLKASPAAMDMVAVDLQVDGGHSSLIPRSRHRVKRRFPSSTQSGKVDLWKDAREGMEADLEGALKAHRAREEYDDEDDDYTDSGGLSQLKAQAKPMSGDKLLMLFLRGLATEQRATGRPLVVGRAK